MPSSETMAYPLIRLGACETDIAMTFLEMSNSQANTESNVIGGIGERRTGFRYGFLITMRSADTLSLPMRIATIAAPIRFADVGNNDLGVVMFDLEPSNQRVLGLDCQNF